MDGEEEFSPSRAVSVSAGAERRPRVGAAWREGRGGRPPAWTQAGVREAIIDGVRLGAPMKHVLAAARVSESAFGAWAQQAHMPDAPEELVELFARIEEAKGKTVLRNVGLLQSAAQDPKQWRAAAWWLERMHPDEFRKPESAAGPSLTTVVVASPDDIRRLQASLEGRRALAGQLAELGPGEDDDDDGGDDNGWEDDDG